LLRSKWVSWDDFIGNLVENFTHLTLSLFTGGDSPTGPYCNWLIPVAVLHAVVGVVKQVERLRLKSQFLALADQDDPGIAGMPVASMSQGLKLLPGGENLVARAARNRR
jgi:hypothetical protein